MKRVTVLAAAFTVVFCLFLALFMGGRDDEPGAEGAQQRAPGEAEAEEPPFTYANWDTRQDTRQDNGQDNRQDNRERLLPRDEADPSAIHKKTTRLQGVEIAMPVQEK